MNEFEFYITIAGIISGFLGITLKLCLKSKCEDVNVCWGLFNIHRNVQIEEDLEINNINRSNSNI